MLFNSGNPNLLDYTRFLVNDPTTATTNQYSTQEVKDAVNLSYLQILGEIKNGNKNVFIKTSFATTVADQVFYSVPTGFGKQVLLEVDYDGNDLETGTTKNPTELKQVTYDFLRTQARANATGVYLWAPFNEHIAIYPAVDTAGTKSMSFVYEYVPDALSGDTDEPEIIPADLHRLICLRAAKDLKIARDLDFTQIERENLMLSVGLIRHFALKDYESFNQFKTSSLDYNHNYGSKQGGFGR